MDLLIILLLHVLALKSYASTTKLTANVSVTQVSIPSQEEQLTNKIQYDNLVADMLSLSASAPGTYENITYNSFLLANISTGVTGIAAHTPPNVIFTTSQPEATKDTPSLTVAKSYTSFDLIDYEFLVNLPIICTQAGIS